MAPPVTPMPSHNGGAGGSDDKREANGTNIVGASAVFHRDLNREFLPLQRSDGHYLFTESGQKIFDGSGGPSVACIGWGNNRVINAVVEQLRNVAYCATIFYTTRVAEDLGRFLVDSTKGHMARAYLMNSGRSCDVRQLCDSGLTWRRLRSDGSSS